MVVVALIIFFPVGLALLWTASPWRRNVKWVVTGLVAAIVVVIGATSPNQPSGGDEVLTSGHAPNATAPTRSTSTSTPTPAVETDLKTPTSETASPIKSSMRPTPSAVPVITTTAPPRTVTTTAAARATTKAPKQAPATTTRPAPKTTSPKPPSLTCSASMTDKHPSHNQTTYVVVHTGAGVTVDTVAHYKSKDTEHTGTANQSGLAQIGYDISRATYGYTVDVDVTVSRSGRTATCTTEFIPEP